MDRGLFLVFEGIDGSGTTTQSYRLANFITGAGFPVVHTREPGGTSLGEKIRQLVLDPERENMHFITELLLYAASRAQHVHELIKPALQAGTPVVCDRFMASTLAYQGYGRGLDLNLVNMVNQIAVANCTPDLTIYLDLPVQEASARRQSRGGRPDRLEAAGEELQKRVCRAYRQIAGQHPDTALLVDASNPPGVVSENILTELRKRWPNFPIKSRGRE